MATSCLRNAATNSPTESVIILPRSGGGISRFKHARMSAGTDASRTLPLPGAWPEGSQAVNVVNAKTLAASDLIADFMGLAFQF